MKAISILNTKSIKPFKIEMSKFKKRPITILLICLTALLWIAFYPEEKQVNTFPAAAKDWVVSDFSISNCGANTTPGFFEISDGEDFFQIYLSPENKVFTSAKNLEKISSLNSVINCKSIENPINVEEI